MKLLLIFLGSGTGGVVRYLIMKLTTTILPLAFPWGTLIVNFTASLVFGLLAGMWNAKQLSDPMRMALVIGFCGGFSTFSAFSADGLQLLQEGKAFNYLLYVVSSIVLCLGATWSGLQLTR